MAQRQLRVAQTESSERRSVQPAGQVGRRRQWVVDRLTEDEIQDLVARFLAGTTRQALADECGVSLSGVARLLRQRGVKRVP